MAARPAPERLAAAGFFAVAMALGLAAGVATLVDEEKRDLPPATAASLWSGRWAQAVSKRVNDAFVARQAFHHLERGAYWLALRDWGARVREGCPGWLFLADELERHREGAAAAETRAKLVASARERLARHGVGLLVVIVPDKSRIESTHLCGLARSPGTDERVARFASRLARADVPVLDLTATLAALPGERYYRSDTHWTEDGANASARAIADRLRALGAVPPRARPDPLPARRIERPGDLVRVAGLDALPAGWGPARDSADARSVPPVAAASDDLFGDAALPKVAVVGTSFSRTSNLVPFLARELGEPVANAAKDGGDFDGSARAYLSSAALAEARPRIVVWEIPERTIEPPIKASERDWLEASKK